MRCHCGEFWCTKHREHAWECMCPATDMMDFDPYTESGDD